MTTVATKESRDSRLNYLQLRIALDRFEQPPTALTTEQQQALELQARNAFAIEKRILGAPEAQAVFVPQAVLDEAVAAIRARYTDPEDFALAMSSVSLDEAGLRAAIMRELKVEATIERLTAAHCTVSDDEVAIYYYEHLDRFTRPELRHARQILITINPEFADNTAPRARRRLAQIAAELQGQPKRFAALARQYSECPSAMDGGRLGRIKRGVLYPNLDKALFALPEGGISDILETEMGLHLLWCERIEPAGPVALDSVQEPIRERLADRKRHLFLRDWLS